MDRPPARILTWPSLFALHTVNLRIQAWLRDHGHEVAELHVMDDPFTRQWRGDPVKLAQYCEAFPWLRWGGAEAFQPPLYEAMAHTEERLEVELPGFDAGLSLVGFLHRGSSIDDADTNWLARPTIKASLRFRELRSRLGRYGVVQMTDLGGEGAELSGNCAPELVQEALGQLREAGEMDKIVFVGCRDDRQYVDKLIAIYDQDGWGGTVNLAGQTALMDALDLMLDARFVLGWPGGPGMLAAHLGVPTVTFWPEKVCEARKSNWCPPQCRGTSYRWLDAFQVKPDEVVDAVLCAMGGRAAPWEPD